jgi:hypothetical protein
MGYIDTLSRLADLGTAGQSEEAEKVVVATQGLKEFFQRNAEVMQRMHSVSAELLLKHGVSKVRTDDMNAVVFAMQGMLKILNQGCLTYNFESEWYKIKLKVVTGIS